MVGKAAKEAAERQGLLVLPEKIQKLGPKSSQHTPEDDPLAHLLKATKTQEGWYITVSAPLFLDMPPHQVKTDPETGCI